MFRTVSIPLLFALAGALTACGGGSGPSPAPATNAGGPHDHAATGAQAPEHGACPFADPDVHLVVADADGGATLTITGPAERVGELREMAARMAAMHAEHHGGGHDHAEHGHHHEGGHSHGAGGGEAGHGGMGHGDMDHSGMHGGAMHSMPEVTVGVDEIDGGVRLTIVATSPDDEEPLRAHLRGHVEAMKKGECPMGMGGASEEQPATSSGEHEH